MKKPVPVALLTAVALLNAGCALPLKTGSSALPTPLEPAAARDADALYGILAGELAGQRGRLEESFAAYLAAARHFSDPRVAERATQIALAARRTDRALEAAQLWRMQDPYNPAVRKILLNLYLSTGARDRALAELEALLGADHATDALLAEVAHALDLPREKALAAAAYFVERLPRRAEVYYIQALLALNYGEIKLAGAALERVLALRPDWVRAHGLQAQWLARSGRDDAARAAFKRVLVMDPGDTALRLLFADHLMRLGDVQAAEGEFRHVLIGRPDHEDASFGLAMALLQAGKEQAARDVLLPLTDGMRWRGQASYYLGQIAFRKRRWDEALGWFDEVGAGPMALEAQLNSVTALSALGRDAEAIQRVHQLRGHLPGEALRFYLMEAELFTRREDHAGAFEVLSRALVELPGRSELLYTRALVAERLGQLEQMEADLTQLLRDHPDDAGALNALGYTLVDRTSRFHEAQRYLERAIALRPDDPAILDSMGWLHFRLGNTQKALDYLKRAWAATHDAEIAAHYGEVLWMSGQQHRARAIWRESVRKDGDTEYLRRIRERFPEAFE